MNDIYFEWDDNKAKINEAKHKVSFQEAKSVFYDEYARVIFDTEHSYNEERFVILGMSALERILVVVHRHKQHNIIRIISARKATKNEQSQYKEFL